MGRDSFPLFGWLHEFWHSLAPASAEAGPRITELDDGRSEFAWRGPPLTFDRQRSVVLRRGRVVARSSDIRWIGIRRIRDVDCPDSWRISLMTGLFSGVHVGATFDDVEASIAAAHLATLTGVRVRSL